MNLQNRKPTAKPRDPDIVGAEAAMLRAAERAQRRNIQRDVKFDIALSFAGEDRGYVDQVANMLRSSGIKIFYDKFEEANLWGKNLYDYLSEIYMNKARYTIVFISVHYEQKMWPNHERQAMQARAFQENQEYILPVRFDNTSVPGILPTIGYIDLREKSPADFVDIIHKKLINSGLTIPSDSIRRSLFSTVSMPRPASCTPSVSVRSTSQKPVPDAMVVAIADNDTTKSGQTDKDGIAKLTIPVRRKYRLLVAHPSFPGAIVDSWDPDEDIVIELKASESIGSIVCMSTCYIPGLSGRLNPKLDTSNRTYLYANNISINGGQNQPATFKINEPFELEDSDGVIMQVQVLHIQGRISLLQYVRPRYEF